MASKSKKKTDIEKEAEKYYQTGYYDGGYYDGGYYDGDYFEGGYWDPAGELGIKGKEGESGTDTTPNNPLNTVLKRATGVEGGWRDGKSAPKSNRAVSYINKPAGLGLLGLVPGPIGMIGKAVNLGIHANNLDAVNSARKSMGLAPLGFKDSVRSLAKDQKGQIARVDVNNANYSVGFEALDQQGRTTMTPEEANKRAAANKVSIKEVADTVNPKSTSVVSKITGMKEGWLGDMLSSKPSTKVDAVDDAKSVNATKAQSVVSKVTGLQEGWAGRMMDDIFSGVPATVAAAKEVSKVASPEEAAKVAAEVADVTKASPAEVAAAVATTTKAQSVPSAATPSVASTSTPSVASPNATAVAPSKGLQSVADVTSAPGNTFSVSNQPGTNKAGFISSFGPNRPNMPSAKTPALDGTSYGVVDAVSKSVANTFGPGYSVVGVSGMENKGNQYGSARHKTGTALDFSVVDPAGNKVTDTGMMKSLAADIAANNPEAGIGYDDDGGYMGTGGMHVDLSGNPGVWGDKGRSINAPGDLKSMVADARQKGLTPNFAFETPTARPTEVEQREMTNSIVNAPPSFAAPMAANQAIADQIDRNNNPAAMTPSAPAATPAGVPATGRDRFGPAAKPDIGMMDANALGRAVGRQGVVSAPAPAGVNPASMDANSQAVAAGRQGPVSNVTPSPGAFDANSAARAQDRQAGITPAGLAPNAHKGTFGKLAESTESYARGVISDSVKGPSMLDGVNLGTASPAQFSALGLTQRTAAEKNAIAHTIAGELGPKSLRDLESVDPAAREAARTELANMVTTIDNRAATAKYGTIANALTPSQYNSLSPEALGVTNANFGLYGNAISAAVGDFYNGTLKPTDYGLTSYYNSEISNPTWGAQMANAVVAGNHTFGSLPEYSPNSAFTAERAAMAAAQRGVPGISSTGMRSESTTAERAGRADASFGVNGSRGDSGIGRNDSAGPGRGSSPGGISSSIGQGGSRADSGIGRNDGAGPGRGSSMGGPGLGGVGKSATSSPGNAVSGASRSTAGKTSSAGSKSNPSTSGNMGKGAGTTSGKGPGIGSA